MPAFFTKSRRVMVILISPGSAVRDPEPRQAIVPRRATRGLRTASRQSPTSRRLQNRLPPRTILRPLDEWVCVARVLCADVLIIPLDLLTGAICNVAEMIRFGRPA